METGTVYRSQSKILIANSTDPTATLTLRNQYAQSTRRRFDALKRETVAYIRDSFAQIRAMGSLAFTHWLNAQIDRLVLEVERDAGGAIMTASNWQLPFVETAFLRGVAFADRQLGDSGFVTTPLEFLGIRPYGVEIEAALARNFADLQNITQEMSQQVEAEIASALRQAQDELDWQMMAAGVADRIEKIGRTRGEVLARTLVVWTFAEATLSRFESAGVGAVAGQAEILTSGDGRVCPLCKDLDGQVFTIAEARGRIPVHGRCRCTWRLIAPARLGVGLV
jgi:SPP1 gp7 family putative phage head morphogenesis protein